MTKLSAVLFAIFIIGCSPKENPVNVNQELESGNCYLDVSINTRFKILYYVGKEATLTYRVRIISNNWTTYIGDTWFVNDSPRTVAEVACPEILK